MLKNHTRFEKDSAPGFLRRFCPDYRVKNVGDIDPEDLAASGIKGVLLDLDNTLLPWKGSEIPDETFRWLEKCRDAGLKLCLVSNTRNIPRLEEIAHKLGIPAVRAWKMKPSKDGFHVALEKLGLQPSEAIMVGDQMFTDVWGGNRMGMITIWVERMHPREFVGTKISRMLESVVLGILERFRGKRKP
jgi:HAD superfamily phosphatase (TIGR01668 family)